MNKPKGLVIVHVDGLGYEYLGQAVSRGHMPFVRSLIDNEGYDPMRYRCGVPSSTPYCQAGILYGDNSEIPSFRWWDKESGVQVTFGGFSTFRRVAHKYFGGCTPLTAGGASIATCYPDSSNLVPSTTGREHAPYASSPPFSQRRIAQEWAMNPAHLASWIVRGLAEVAKTNLRFWRSMASGRPAAKTYVIADMLDEILLHHITLVATIEAMKANYPVIYSAFYAYDETAHAFGPGADYSFRVLRHIDKTIRHIASQRHRSGGRDYDLIVISDHGQVETIPFAHQYRRRLGQMISEWLPTFEIEETKAKPIRRADATDGHIALEHAGGLAHVYFKDISWRLSHEEIERRFPGLVRQIACVPGIDFVLTREGTHNVITTTEGAMRYGARSSLTPRLVGLFGRYDHAEIVARQLHKLNSFKRSGDLILFGKQLNGRQINFEDQIGGHGSIGGEQQFPFVLAKREWKLDLSGVVDASGIYPLIQHLQQDQ